MGLAQIFVLSVFVVVVFSREIIPFFKRRYALRNIAGPPNPSWRHGNWRQLFDKNGWAFKKYIQDYYGGLIKLHAPFGDQQLYITDPLAITHIFQIDRPLYDLSEHNLIRARLTFGCGLVGSVGNVHTRQRRFLAPFFSTKFLRSLLPLFYPFGYEVCNYIERRSKSNGGVMNMHQIMSVVALEYVGAGFGYRFDGLNENKPNVYNEATKMINPLTFRLAIFRAVLPLMVKLGPAWFRKAIIDWLPWRDAQLLKKAIYTIDDIAWDVLNTRRREYEDGNTNGKDILSAILRFNEEAEEGEKISDLEIVSHITTILFAGHETTAGTLSRILYQMAILPDAQARLRKEVTDARKANGDLDLEALMALPYLDAICKETLRLYPPADQLYRTSNSSAIIPLMYPVQSADGMSKVDRVAIEPHTDIIIPIIGYNRNKDVWGPDAEEWLPERWLKPPRKSVLDAKLPAVYSSMLTFTMGPRACLGYKFAEMEMKLILTMLFERFEFSISPKDEIFWQLGGSVTPVVKGTGSIEPDLPLKVTPLVE